MSFMDQICHAQQPLLPSACRHRSRTCLRLQLTLPPGHGMTIPCFDRTGHCEEFWPPWAIRNSKKNGYSNIGNIYRDVSIPLLSTDF